MPFKAPEIWLPVKEEEPGPWVSAAKMVSRSGATVIGEATVLPWLFYLRFQRERMLYVQWAWISDVVGSHISILLQTVWFWVRLVAFVPFSHPEERGCSFVGCCVAPAGSNGDTLARQFLFLEVHSLVWLFWSTGFEGSEILPTFVLQICEGCSSRRDMEAITLWLGLCNASLLSHCLPEVPQKSAKSHCSTGVGPNCLQQTS